MFIGLYALLWKDRQEFLFFSTNLTDLPVIKWLWNMEAYKNMIKNV